MSKINDLIKELCPNGVEYKNLDAVCSVNKGKQLNKEGLLSDGMYPVINGGITPSGYWNEYNCDENLITISQGGASAGYIAYQLTKFWAGAHCYFVERCKDNIDYKYLYHFLKSKQDDLQSSQVGAGIPSVSLKEIYGLRIPVPPLEVQEEIAQILDKFGELEAELEAELESRKSQYEFWRVKVLNMYEYKSIKLSDMAKVYDGTHSTPNYQLSGIPFISVENILNIYSSNKYISEEDFQKYKIKPQINDVFMTRIGSIGKCSVFDRQVDLAYYVSLALIRPNTEIILPKYLKYVIESSIGKDELYKRTLVHAVPIKVNKDEIGKIVLPVPSIDDQKKIISKLDKFESLTESISVGLPAEIELRRKQYEYYRNKLLSFEELSVSE